jgi:AraC-like DNA-binding protein
MQTLIRTLAARYGHGHEIGDHDHGWGQLVYASAGAIHVLASGQAWLIPPSRAVWLPPSTPHRLRMRGTTRLHTLYIPPVHCDGLAPAPLGLTVSPLLRELIEELVRIGHIDAADRFHRALAEALLITLSRAERLPLSLRLPSDRSALRVAETILASPASSQTLDAIATKCGASLRTIQRRFLEETAMPLSEWRQLARLMAAAALLIDGNSVTDAALEGGYAGVSAFTHAFRGKLGQTPSAFRQAASANSSTINLRSGGARN